MSNFSRLLILAFGLLLVCAGLGLWLTGGMSLPTRHPPVRFHFSGLALLLVGSAPAVSGGVLLALGMQKLDREAPATRGLLFAAMALLALAFVLAPKH
ncbi:MAG: hypothetical protein EOO29_12170 [Comamonadaceae bacterium]|nr:MAG: hypothetical protein EOO29_12170 [Comamonadaceae bacterium]